MAAIDFPADLPRPSVEGHGIQHTSPFVRTEMVSGRARQRRAFASGPSMVPSMSWVFTSVEAQLFEAWFRDQINDGVDWFNCKLRTPLDQGAADGVGDYEVRFTQMYSVQQYGPLCWKISAAVEINSRPVIAPGWSEFPDFILGGSIIDQAINREWPEA